jgi:heme oxygenase (mycobilin-producing)
MAITAILDMQLKPEALETAFPGCYHVAVLVDSDDPAHVILYETWESVDHDRAYRAWRATPEGASRLGSILAARPKLTLFTVADGV